VTLRLLDFPEWRVAVDGEPIQTERNANAEIRFRLPAGTHQARIQWGEPHRTSSGLVSILALLAMAFLAVFGRGKPLRPGE
jgi:hypothetical protein